MIVCIYENFTEISDEAIPSLLAALPTFRAQQASSYKISRDVKASALSYLMLEYLLGFQPEFVYNEFGKPRVGIAGAPAFSISHSEDTIAVAVSEVSGASGVSEISEMSGVGIDVEQHSALARLQGLSDSGSGSGSVFSAGERARPELLVKFWTLKESRIKFLGRGLDPEHLAGQDFSAYADESTFATGGLYYCVNRYKDYWLSICCSAKPDRIEIMDYRALSSK
jgi:phosphopantetheinyl transferase